MKKDCKLGFHETADSLAAIVSSFCRKWLYLLEILNHFRINTKPGLHEIAHSFKINIFYLHEIADEYTINHRSEVAAKVAGERGPEYSGALIGLILDLFISWNSFSKLTEIARNIEIVGKTKCVKTKIFLIVCTK